MRVSPTPWREEYFKDGDVSITDASDHFVAHLNTNQLETPRNAALIAAAPDLLATLTDLLAAVDTLTRDDPTHYEVATAVGLPALKARQLCERLKGRVG